MISKERLQELIDQKATIWSEGYGEIQLTDISEVCGIKNSKDGMIISYCLFGFICGDSFTPCTIMPEELEEDVEKGKWNNEMHASRLERFEPPVWEEMTKKTRFLNCWTMEFIARERDEPIGIALIGVDFSCEIVSVEMGSNKYFAEPLTKENYARACTIARKLFIGESIE